MFKIMLAAFFAVLTMSSSAFADGGCSSGVAGAYIRTIPSTDVFGNGSNVAHTWVYQLTLHSDGTAFQTFSGAPDYLMELGTETPFTGSWKCRSDGKLVVTIIDALYNPLPFGAPECNYCTPVPDLVLASPVSPQTGAHRRVTYLFSVESNGTLKRLKARFRFYDLTQDPANATAGTLGPINTDQVVYKRIKASDADLLAP